MVLYIGAGAVGVIGVVVAYRRQQGIEEGHFLERLAEAARQLGDQNPTVQAAGIYTLAGLADASPKDRRQQCIDVLCAYLRLPYIPWSHDAGDAVAEKIVRTRTMRTTTGETEEEQTFSLRPHDRETRQTIIRVISQHLRPEAPVSWSALNFDFNRVVFDGGQFNNTRFVGDVSFQDAQFVGGTTSFREAEFLGRRLNFTGAKFIGGTVNFTSAQFKGEMVRFAGALFADGVIDFSSVEFSAATVDFYSANFHGGNVRFKAAKITRGNVVLYGAEFLDGTVNLQDIEFAGGTTDFQAAKFLGGVVDFKYGKFTGGTINFSRALFGGSTVNFEAAEFIKGEVIFRHARFDGGDIDLSGAGFTGGTVEFRSAHFNGTLLDFQNPARWSHPPLVPWSGTPPLGILPENWPPSTGESASL